MGERCKDCGRQIATERDLSCCDDGCKGCDACRAFCWRLFHADVCPFPRKRRLIGWRVRYEWRHYPLNRWIDKSTDLQSLPSAQEDAACMRRSQSGAYRNVRVMRVYRRTR